MAVLLKGSVNSAHCLLLMAVVPILCAMPVFSQDSPGALSSPTQPTSKDKSSSGAGASTAPTESPAPWTTPQTKTGSQEESAVGATAGKSGGQETSPTRAPNPWGSGGSGAVTQPSERPSESPRELSEPTVPPAQTNTAAPLPPANNLSPEQSRFTEYFIVASACLGLLIAFLLWRTNPPQKPKKEPEA